MGVGRGMCFSMQKLHVLHMFVTLVSLPVTVSQTLQGVYSTPNPLSWHGVREKVIQFYIV